MIIRHKTLKPQEGPFSDHWSWKHWFTVYGAWVAIALAGALLGGCATTIPQPPKTVEVPVPVRCAPALGPEPAYPDTDAALKAKAGDPFAQVQLLTEGRLLRIQRDLEKSAALLACESGPVVSTTSSSQPVSSHP